MVTGPARIIGKVFSTAGFSGPGSELTALNASNVSQGTLSADRLATSGVTAGNYGPTANVSPAAGGSFSVPYVTVDNKGRVTSAATRTITLPASAGGFVAQSTAPTNTSLL